MPQVWKRSRGEFASFAHAQVCSVDLVALKAKDYCFKKRVCPEHLAVRPQDTPVVLTEQTPASQSPIHFITRCAAHHAYPKRFTSLFVRCLQADAVVLPGHAAMHRFCHQCGRCAEGQLLGACLPVCACVPWDFRRSAA